MKKTLIILIIGIILITISIIAQPQDLQTLSADDFTLTYQDTSYGFSIGYLKDNYQTVTGLGGRLNQVGNIAGPYTYTGVPISVLADEFPNLSDEYTMVTISSDGYVVHYTHDEINGAVTVYDEEGTIVQSDEVTMILAYIEDEVENFYGGPLRIAFIEQNGLFTDSFLWSKDIIAIEFHDASNDNIRPTISLTNPQDAIYLFGTKLVPYTQPFIIGDVTIKASIMDTNTIAQAIFTIEPDDAPAQIKTIRGAPYQWDYTEKALGSHTLIITAYDEAGNIGQIEKKVFIFNPF